MSIRLLIKIICGLVVGNFLYLCIDRISKEEKVFKAPLIIKSKGNLALSIITSLLFTIIFITYGVNFISAKFTVLISILIVIGVIDYKTTDVYFKTTLVGMILGVTFIIIGYFSGVSPKQYILTGLIVGGSVAFIHLITGGGIGGGDAEVLAICGLFLGAPLTILVIVLSITSAAAIGLFLIVIKKKSFKDHMPFVPYITVATIILILCINNFI